MDEKVVKLSKRRPAAPEPSRRQTVVEALLTAESRRKLTQHIVDTAREFSCRGDRVDMWNGTIARLRAQARAEGADGDLISRGLDLLSRDVKMEGTRRDKLVEKAAEAAVRAIFAGPSLPDARVYDFPGDQPLTEHDVTLPLGIR